jgi:Family of unknown function (DUF6459)
MQLNPPPGLPSHKPLVPATPVTGPIPPTPRSSATQCPLPEPGGIRRVPVPDSAPPYDGEEAASPRAGPADSSGPSGPAPSRTAGPRGRAGAAEGRPGAGAWPSQFAQALAEALAGSRPAQQLTPWTTEQARKRIRQLGPLLATGQRPRLRRLMTSAPACDVLELTAVVGFGPRVRVLALRLERVADTGEHWRCTEIESA